MGTWVQTPFLEKDENVNQGPPDPPSTVQMPSHHSAIKQGLKGKDNTDTSTEF